MTRHLFKTLLFSSLLVISVVAHSADSGRIAATLETLRQSVNAHDFARLEPSLADNFTYQGNDAGMSQMIMRQVVAGFPTQLSAINVISISETEEAWEIAVGLESAADTDQRMIRLTKNYRLLQADIADIQLAGHAPAAPNPQTITAVPADRKSVV